MARRPRGGAATSSAARPFLVTSDPLLLDDLLRLCAAAGVEARVASDLAAAAAWQAAPLVVLGADVLRGHAQPVAGPRRGGVVVAARQAEDVGLWRSAIAAGAERLVVLPEGEAWLAHRLADAVEGPGRAGAVVGVVGGRGGAGATTLAVALAVVAGREGREVLLVDADRLGGGIDLALGAEHVPGLRWPDLVGTRGRVSPSTLADALPVAGGVHVLSWARPLVAAGELSGAGDAAGAMDAGVVGRPSSGGGPEPSPEPGPDEALRAVLAAGRRGFDLTVVDLPRHLDAATTGALPACDVTLLVVPAEVRATAAAAGVAAALAGLAGDLRVVVRGPAPGRLGPSEVAGALGLPLLGHMGAEPRLAQALDHGDPPGLHRRGPLAGLCRRLLADLCPPVEARGG